MTRWLDYQAYLLSEKWQQKRRAALKRAGYKCQYCGKSGIPLQVHHLHYRNFGKEKPNDLRVACEDCHPIADQIRRFEAGLETYMTKKYGKNWEKEIKREDAIEEFRRWLRWKNAWQVINEWSEE